MHMRNEFVRWKIGIGVELVEVIEWLIKRGLENQRGA